MAGKKFKEYSQERWLSHVYRIDDDVMHDVREFLLVAVHSLYAPDDVKMSVSDFLSKTRVPYRSKSRIYEIQK